MEEKTILFGRLEEVEPIYDKSDVNCRACLKEKRKGIRQDQIPFPRSGHRIVMTNDCLYSIGGYNPAFQRVENISAETNYPLFKELWRYNLANRSWTLLRTSGDMPSLLASHYAVLYCDRYLLVYGGTGVPFGNPCSAEVHCCDLQTLRWSILDCSGDIPTGTYGHTLTLVGDRLYKVGGTTGFEYNMLVYELNLTTRKWTLLSRVEPSESNAAQAQLAGVAWNAPVNVQWNVPGNFRSGVQRDPAPRYRHETVHYDGSLYVFGGGRATVSFGFRRVAVFDLRKRSWQFKVCYPDPVRAAVEPPLHPFPDAPDDPNLLLNLGDHDGEGVEPGAEANGAAYHYVNAAGFPRARKCHAAVRCGSKVWLIGGFDNERIMNDVWCIDLSTLRWRFASDWPSARYFHAAAATPRTNALYVFGGVRRIDNQRSAAVFRTQLAVAPLERLAWQVVSERLSANACFILRNRLDLQAGFELVRSDTTNSLPCCSNAADDTASPFRNRPPAPSSRPLAPEVSDDSDSHSESSDNPDSDDQVAENPDQNLASRARGPRGRVQRARTAFSLLRRSAARKHLDSDGKPQNSVGSKSYNSLRHTLFGWLSRSKTKSLAKRSRRGARSDEMELESDSGSDLDDCVARADESASESSEELLSFRERHERIVQEQRAYLESVGVPWLVADRLVESGAPRSRDRRNKADSQMSSASVSALVGLSNSNASAY